MTFPKLIPAFTARIPIVEPNVVGSAKGGLNLIRILSSAEAPAGSLTSEPGYPIRVDAQFVHGADFIRPDVDGKRLRLNVNCVLKQRGTDDAFLNYSYTGVVEVTPEIGAVFAGAPGAATTPFGDTFTLVSFESGHPSLQALEHKVYVGAGRFVLQEGQPLTVEYKISEVTV